MIGRPLHAREHREVAADGTDEESTLLVPLDVDARGAGFAATAPVSLIIVEVRTGAEFR